jgi:hypothetical protein
MDEKLSAKLEKHRERRKRAEPHPHRTAMRPLPASFPAWFRKCPYCMNRWNRFGNPKLLADLAKQWGCTEWEATKDSSEYFHYDAEHQRNDYDGIRDVFLDESGRQYLSQPKRGRIPKSDGGR